MHLANRFNVIIKLYPYLWPQAWSIRFRLIVAISLLLATMVLNIWVPLLLRQVINTLSTQPTSHVFAELLLIGYGVVWSISKASDQLRLMAMNRVVEHGIRLLSFNVFEHLLNLSARFHADKKTGGILNAIDRAQFAFPGVVYGLFFLIVPTLIEILAAAIILVCLFGYLYGLILAFILIAFMLFSVLGSLWSLKAQQEAMEKSSTASSKIVDSLLNYETIRCFNNKHYETTHCEQLLAQKEEANTKQHFRGELVLLGQALIMGVGLILLTWLSGNQVLSGAINISDFVLINVYLLQFMVPLGHFGYVFRDMNEGLTNLEEIMHLLEEQPEIQNTPNATPLTLTDGTIVFDNVSFGYDARRPILNSISFSIPPQKTVAIVGPTGAGKSTIAKLLFRYYNVTAGRILIDGQDIQCVTQESLQTVIGIVPQQTALFNETLRYNIAYGKPDADEDNIQQAVFGAHLESFVASLPDGLESIVGENGLKLSGGERQRVAIARILLKKPAIFVFDEATSSLDTKTEQLIQSNIEEVSSKATTLIIAHRLSTIVHADQIIVLDKGKIVETGTHKELLKHQGLYAQLWAKQIKEHHE